MSLEPKKPTCVNLSQLRRNAQISRKGKKSGGKRQGDYIVIAAPDAKINKMTSGTKTYKGIFPFSCIAYYLNFFHR